MAVIMDPLTDEEKVKLDASSILLDIETPSSELSTPKASHYLKANHKNIVLHQSKIPSPQNSASGWLATVNKRQQNLTNLQIFCKSKITSISRDGSTKLTKAGFTELFSSQVI